MLSVKLESSRVSLNAIISILLLDIEYRISSIFFGRLTIFKKAILKPLSVGIELKAVEKELLAF